MPVGPSYRESWSPSSSTSRGSVAAPVTGRRSRMRDVREQGTERHDELDAEVAREPDDEVRESAPPVVRLDPEKDDRVAVGARDRGVEERVLGPFDASREARVESHCRTNGLEVDEALGVDVREPRRVPLLRQVAGGDCRSLPAIVPAAERRDHHGAVQRRVLAHAQVRRSHGNSVTAVSRTAAARRACRCVAAAGDTSASGGRHSE